MSVRIPLCNTCGRQHYNFQRCDGTSPRSAETGWSVPVGFERDDSFALKTPTEKLLRPRDGLRDVGDRSESRDLSVPGAVLLRRKPLHEEMR